MTGLKIVGWVWLTAVAAALVYFIWPVVQDPSRASGAAGVERIVPPLFMAIFASLPGALLVAAGSRRK